MVIHVMGVKGVMEVTEVKRVIKDNCVQSGIDSY
jgi:hypothetical protein